MLISSLLCLAYDYAKEENGYSEDEQTYSVEADKSDEGYFSIPLINSLNQVKGRADLFDTGYVLSSIHCSGCLQTFLIILVCFYTY